MRFAIYCLDQSNAVDRRLAHYEAHKSYLAHAPLRMVISGPLLAPDQETMIGSLFIVDADSVEEVEAFSRADPFQAASVWAQVSIHPFIMRVDNRDRDK